MSWTDWTESLTDDLRSALQFDPEGPTRRQWQRIEPAKHGGWWFQAVGSCQQPPPDAQAQTAHPESHLWFALEEGASRLEAVPPFRDRHLPAMSTLVSEWLRHGYSVQLVGHKVGRRAVFKVDGVPLGNGHQRQWVKIYRKPRELVERWTMLPSAHTPQNAGPNSVREDLDVTRWRVPQVHAWDPQKNALTLEDCDGEPLNSLWGSGRGSAEDGDRVAELLSWMTTTEVCSRFPRHTREDELEGLQRGLELLPLYCREYPAEMSQLVDDSSAALADDPCTQLCPSHRDFHDKQILLSGPGGALIDLDLASLAPAGLDPGNIIAHARLRSLRGFVFPWQEICARIARATHRRLQTEESLYRWVAATLTRLVFVYSRRRRTPTLLAELAASAQHALERTGEWKGIL